MYQLHFHLIRVFVYMLVCTPILLHAHDTNTTHPRLTISAGNLINAEDETKGAYFDLWNTQAGILHDKTRLEIPHLWGQDPRFSNETDKLDDEADDYEAFRHSYQDNGKPRNVVDGVVMEDTPVTRVFSHFQHAYTGQGMSVDGVYDFLVGLGGNNDNSQTTAMRYFMDSIEIMGYLEDKTDEHGVLQTPNMPFGCLAMLCTMQRI